MNNAKFDQDKVAEKLQCDVMGIALKVWGVCDRSPFCNFVEFAVRSRNITALWAIRECFASLPSELRRALAISEASPEQVICALQEMEATLNFIMRGDHMNIAA